MGGGGREGVIGKAECYMFVCMCVLVILLQVSLSNLCIMETFLISRIFSCDACEESRSCGNWSLWRLSLVHSRQFYCVELEVDQSHCI